MNFQDLVEKLTAQLKTLWEKTQESALYIQLKDRYEGLSPLGQKLVKWGISVAAAALSLSFPWSYYDSSVSYMEEFTEFRRLSFELSRQATETVLRTQVASAPSIEGIRSRIDGLIKDQNIPLENVRFNQEVHSAPNLIPQSIVAGQLRLEVQMLNLKQATDLASHTQAMGPAVKIKDLSLIANTKDPRYVDLTMQVVTLKTSQDSGEAL